MVVGGKRHTLAAFPLGKRPGTHSTEGWVDSRVVLDWCGKSHPCRTSILGPSGP